MIERYTRKAMGELWSLEKRFAAWLEVELAVCEAWAELGRISGRRYGGHPGRGRL